MTVTTAFAAKDAILALLQGDSALNGVDKWYGYSGASGEWPRELVWVGEIEWDYEEPATLGNLQREEQYRILLTIEIHRPGDNQRESNLRAKEIMERVETLLRQRNPLGIPNIISVGLVPQLLGEGSDADGRGAILVTSVQVRARK